MSTKFRSLMVGLVIVISFAVATSVWADSPADVAQANPPPSGPNVSDVVVPFLSPDLRSLTAPEEQGVDGVAEIVSRNQGDLEIAAISKQPIVDPLWRVASASRDATPSPPTSLTFEGIANTANSPFRVAPPDTVGDVGPNHYVQMVNVSVAVFDKTGNILAGPVPTNALWAGHGSECEFSNSGDPVVLYDHLADRWLITQFAVFTPQGNFLCMAVSQTPDPTGAYFLYAFGVPFFPDYPKYAVWPDAYYMSANLGPPTVGVFAFDRVNMLAGNPATFVNFILDGVNFMLPGDLDGPLPWLVRPFISIQ